MSLKKWKASRLLILASKLFSLKTSKNVLYVFPLAPVPPLWHDQFSNYLLRAISPPWREKNKIESDNYIWHLYLTVTFDIHIWHLYLTVTFGIYIWHLSLTFISDISIWHLYLTFKSVLIYKRIAKPFILPLQIFASITNNTSFSQNSRNNAASHPQWQLLTSPIVEKNMCIFLT